MKCSYSHCTAAAVQQYDRYCSCSTRTQLLYSSSSIKPFCGPMHVCKRVIRSLREGGYYMIFTCAPRRSLGTQDTHCLSSLSTSIPYCQVSGPVIAASRGSQTERRRLILRSQPSFDVRGRMSDTYVPGTQKVRIISFLVVFVCYVGKQNYTRTSYQYQTWAQKSQHASTGKQNTRELVCS